MRVTRFYFHSTGAFAYRDEEGVELADAPAAEAEALRVLGELLKDAPASLSRMGSLELEVTDAGGHRIFSLQVTARRTGC